MHIFVIFVKLKILLCHSVYHSYTAQDHLHGPIV